MLISSSKLFIQAEKVGKSSVHFKHFSAPPTSARLSFDGKNDEGANSVACFTRIADDDLDVVDGAGRGAGDAV